MRMPSFARRHPWIGLLIVATIGVGSWMLLRAPQPATESMPLAAARGHQHQRVAIGDDVIDDGLLLAAEVGVAEHLAQDGRRRKRYHVRKTGKNCQKIP